MPELLPKWIMRRYLVLWKNLGEKEFTFEEAKEILDEDARIISIFLSELKKYTWLNIKLDPEDARKRIYQLRPHDKVIDEIAKSIKVSEDR